MSSAARQGSSRTFLIALLLLSVLAIGFVAMADIGGAVEKDVLRALAFRDGKTPDALIQTAQWITWLGDAAQRSLFIIVAALWLLWRKRPGAALVMAVLPVLASASSSLLKEAFARARPAVVPHLDTVSNLSYPSGHATNVAAAFLLAAMLIPTRNRRGWLAVAALCVILVGASRIVLGVHWPSDVVGGWLLGFAFALGAQQLAKRLENRIR